MTAHTSLLQNRHLDQVIICSMYSVCKLKNFPVSFKVLIEHFKNLNVSYKIFREVDLKDGLKGDIINFYNNVFIPEIEKSLFVIATSFSETSMISVPLEIPSPMKLKDNPQQVMFSPVKSFVRPDLRSSTPFSKTIVIGAQSPGKDMKEINAKLRVTQKSKKKLFMDDLAPTANTSTKRKLDVLVDPIIPEINRENNEN